MREFRGQSDRRGGVAHLVMLFKARFQSFEDTDGLFHAGFADIDFLKSPMPLSFAREVDIRGKEQPVRVFRLDLEAAHARGRISGSRAHPRSLS